MMHLIPLTVVTLLVAGAILHQFSNKDTPIGRAAKEGEHVIEKVLKAEGVDVSFEGQKEDNKQKSLECPIQKHKHDHKHKHIHKHLRKSSVQSPEEPKTGP